MHTTAQCLSFLFSSFLAESLELLLLGLRGHQPTEAEPLFLRFVYAIEAAAIALTVVLKDYYFDGLVVKRQLGVLP